MGRVEAIGGREAYRIVAAAKVVGSATGITDAINCVRNPTLVGCLTAVGKLALTASAFVDGGASLGLEAELEGGELAAEEGLSVAADEGGSLAAEDASISDSTIIARGGQSPLPPPGEVFSGAQGQTVEEAGQGVVHGSFRSTTAGDIRAGGGTAEPAPEFNEGVGQPTTSTWTCAWAKGPVNGAT